MHSVAIVSVLAAAGFAAAAPALAPRGSQYVCASNGFNGLCSVDACNLAWCPDYQLYTYVPIVRGEVAPAPVPEVSDPKPEVSAPKPWVDPTVCPQGTGFFQSCSNGFRGCCKSDACGAAWCPDYKQGSYTPANTWVVRTRTPAVDPTVCSAGTGFFQSCSNGFRGCCKSDACGAAGWCPDFKFGTYELVGSTAVVTPVAKPETPVVAKPETPVVKVETPVVVKPVASNADPTVCAPNTGFFQSCSNGFRGCCKQDACSIGWCPGN